MEPNLESIRLLCSKNESICKYLNFDFSDAFLALELRYADNFLIYYSGKSTSFLLLHFGSTYAPDSAAHGESFQHFVCCSSLSEILEEINEILKLAFMEFNFRTNKWYSTVPPWLILDVFYVSVDFTDEYLQLVQNATIEANDLSLDEIIHIKSVISKLKAKINSL